MPQETPALTARQAADQLGHAKVSMTQDSYYGRKVARTGAAELLEIFGDRQPQTNPGGIPGAADGKTGRSRPLAGTLLPRLDSNQQPCDMQRAVAVVTRR
jgi:hypothetical protein